LHNNRWVLPCNLLPANDREILIVFLQGKIILWRTEKLSISDKSVAIFRNNSALSGLLVTIIELPAPTMKVFGTCRPYQGILKITTKASEQSNWWLK
jgi:hypothetical protein